MPCLNFGGVLHSICWMNTIGSALKILILEDKGLQIPWDGGTIPKPSGGYLPPAEKL